MTVSSLVHEVSYFGNGTNKVFAYPFRILDDHHLKVYVDDVLFTGQQTVSGVGDYVGGDVTLSTAPAAGLTVKVTREVPITQLVDYIDYDAFPAETHETALDKLTMILQQLDSYADSNAADIAANLVKILMNTSDIAALRVYSDQMDADLRRHSDALDASHNIRISHNLDLINNIHLILEGHDPRITENREAILVLFTITEVLEKGILENRGLIVDNANDIVDNANDIGDLQHTTHLINSLIHDMYQCCVDFKYQLSHFTLDQIIDVYTTNAKDHDLLVRMNGGWQAMTPPGFATGVDWTPGMSFTRNTIYNPKVQAAGEHLAIVLATPLTQHVDGVTQHLRLTVSEPTDITFASEFKVVPLITTTGSYNLTFHYIGGIVHVDVSKAEAGFGRGGFGSGKFGLPLT